MSEKSERSRYWLSPGVDVPTRDELLPSYERLRGFYADRDAGEAAFVPTADFMRECPLWRIDVLGDILQDVEQTRRHALVSLCRECQARVPGVPMERALYAFRSTCDFGGIELPDELEAMLVLDHQFGRSRKSHSR
jgi:hypothetical protein